MCSIQTLFIFLTAVLCALFSINLQFQKQSRPQSKTITEARVWCYIPHNALAGQQFVFWNNNEPEYTLLSVVRLLVQYSKFRNRLIALRCCAHFTWALSVMIALKISVLTSQAIFPSSKNKRHKPYFLPHVVMVALSSSKILTVGKLHWPLAIIMTTNALMKQTTFVV